MGISIRGSYLLSRMIPKDIQVIMIRKDGVWINIDKKGIEEVIIFLKKSQVMQYSQLLDITAVDYPERESRFEVLYNLLSILYGTRLYIKIGVKEVVRTVTEVYKSAGWLEREVWDMFGIVFEGNMDLRRILTDYGFVGYPMRKDFPLSGYVEVRYEEEIKKIVTEAIEVSQEYRNFDFLTPWKKDE
jgi:NADH/F420H2 dehydrogenase subunit C